MNSFNTNKNPLLIFFWFYQFVNNFFELLLWEFNGLNIFIMVGFFLIFVVSRNTEILDDSNFWLKMYVACMRNTTPALYDLLWSHFTLSIKSPTLSPSFTSSLRSLAIAGTGGNSLRVSMITLSRYFISRVSWYVHGRFEPLNIPSSSS